MRQRVDEWMQNPVVRLTVRGLGFIIGIGVFYLIWNTFFSG